MPETPLVSPTRWVWAERRGVRLIRRCPCLVPGRSPLLAILLIIWCILGLKWVLSLAVAAVALLRALRRTVFTRAIVLATLLGRTSRPVIVTGRPTQGEVVLLPCCRL